jgi:hypothetical protein
MDWPPDLADLKADRGVDDDRDDVKLQMVLDAAIVVVKRLRDGELNFTGDPASTLPAPDADFVLGTIRLAWRWHERRKSPDALINMGEAGMGRVPSFDPDIELLLQIDRRHPPVIA